MVSVSAKPDKSAALDLFGMDILVLSPTPTYPLDHGNRKYIHAYCSDLKRRGARIHFLYYPLEWPFSDIPEEAVEQMRHEWDAFYMAPVTISVYQWAKGSDHMIDEWWDPGIGNYLAFLFARRQFDAFIINYPFLSKGFEFAPKWTYRILVMHDKFTDRRSLLEANGITKEFFYTTREQEAIALNRAHLVWAIKEEEAEFFNSISNMPAITFPHVEEVHSVERRGSPGDEEYLVLGMIGARNSINLRNTERFLKEVLPRFRHCLAPIKIRLAGGMCDDLTALGELPGVELLGRVEDVSEFYESVDVVLVPMTFSTGLKIKAIEAFATGMPVIAHRHAVEGIPVEHPFHQCDSLDQIADACLEVAYNRDLLFDLVDAGREAYTRLAAVMNASLDETCRRISAVPSILVPLSPRFLERDSLYREHCVQVLDYLKHLGKLLLYFDRTPVGSQAMLFKRFDGYGLIAKLVMPGPNESQAVEGATVERSCGLRTIHSGLREIIARRSPTAVWLLDLPAELKEPDVAPRQQRLYVRVDVLRAFEIATDNDIVSLFTLLPSAVRVDCGLTDEPGCCDIETAQNGLAVPFWRWTPETLTKRAREDRVVILADEADMPLAYALWRAFKVLAPEWKEPYVVTGGLQETGETDQGRWQTDVRYSSHIMTMPEYITRLMKSDEPLSSGCVDLSPLALSLAPIRELVIRCGLWRIPKSGGVNGGGSGLMQEGTVDKLISGLSALLDDREQASAAEQATLASSSVRYGNDAGWLNVWRSIVGAHSLH